MTWIPEQQGNGGDARVSVQEMIEPYRNTTQLQLSTHVSEYGS